MADVKGLACLLKVGDGASPEVFTTLEGQTDTSFDGSTNVADSTAKDNDGWSTGVATTRSGTVSVSGNLRETRAQLDILEAAWVGGTTNNCQIVFDAAGNGYEGSFYITAFNVTGPTNDLTTYSLTLTPAAALTAIPA